MSSVLPVFTPQQALATLTDQQLVEELNRRHEAAIAAKEASLLERGQLGLSAIETLLRLVPEHDRTSCSDADYNNGSVGDDYGPRCVRCFLLKCRESAYWPGNAELKLSITRYQRPKKVNYGNVGQ